jgi:hypothetical protein
MFNSVEVRMQLSGLPFGNDKGQTINTPGTLYYMLKRWASAFGRLGERRRRNDSNESRVRFYCNNPQNNLLPFAFISVKF